MTRGCPEMTRGADMTRDYTYYRRITLGITKKSVGLHSVLQKKTVGLHSGLQKKTVGLHSGLQLRITCDYIGLQREYIRFTSEFDFSTRDSFFF